MGYGWGSLRLGIVGGIVDKMGIVIVGVII
jgi:hypothetical protein